MKRKKSAVAGDREDVCFICGKQGRMEKHHMLHGPYRKAADRYALSVTCAGTATRRCTIKGCTIGSCRSSPADIRTHVRS